MRVYRLFLLLSQNIQKQDVCKFGLMVGHHYLVNPIQSLRLGLCNNSPTKNIICITLTFTLLMQQSSKILLCGRASYYIPQKRSHFNQSFRHAAKENVPHLVAKKKIRLGLLRINSLLCTRQSFFLVSKHFEKFNNFLLLTAALDSSLHQSLHNNKVVV